MTKLPDRLEEIDWTLTTWEGSRREQMRRWAALPPEDMIEEMDEFARAIHGGTGHETGVVASGSTSAHLSAMGNAADIPPDALSEFEAAARRPLAQRWRYAFVKTHKPVLDDALFRSFDSMEEYRGWCERNLPPWLGYGRSL